MERQLCPILARPPGFAFGLANYRNNDGELILQLVRDDVPISGRSSTCKDGPSSGHGDGAQVRAPAAPSLDAWLKALEERKGFHLEHQILPSRL